MDSGSTHTFIKDGLVERLGLNITPRVSLSIKVANGERVTSCGICTATPADIHGELFHLDCYVLPLDTFDIVLGVRWLKTLGPIFWDFEALTMAFWRHGRAVLWCGMGGTGMSIRSISTAASLMETLLADYGTIFDDPQGLPPRCQVDHCIHLLPDIAPVTVHPYRYL